MTIIRNTDEDALNLRKYKKPVPLGSANCPTCGRFSRIIKSLDEPSGRYVVVYCGVHGSGVA